MSKEAMKLALEALEDFSDVIKYDNENDDIGYRACCHVLSYDSHSKNCKATKAITALQEALAEQPAQQEPVGSLSVRYHRGCKSMTNTDFDYSGDLPEGDYELYTSPPAQQEPLEYWNAVEGWVKIDEVRKHFDSVGCGTIYKTAGDGRVPLTAAQRKPLTGEEMNQIEARWDASMHGSKIAFVVRETEAAHDIKEKNT